MKSLSATEKNINQFEWFTYTGTKKEKLTNRGRIVFLAEGKKFGMMPLARSGGIAVVFEDNLKVSYKTTEKQATAIMKKAKKARKPTNLEQKLKDSKGKRMKPEDSANSKRKMSWDHDRYQGDGKRLPSPRSSGIDFNRFQWRKIATPIVTIQKTKQKTQEFAKNDLIGVRFDSPARGGLVVDRYGNHAKVTTKLYDHIVENSKLMPKNKWLTDRLSAQDIAQLKRDETDREAQEEQMRREAEAKRKEKIRKARLAKRQAQKKERQERIEREKAQVEEYKKGEQARITKEQERIKKASRPSSQADKLDQFLNSALDTEEDDELIGDIDLDANGNEAEPEPLYDKDELEDDLEEGDVDEGQEDEDGDEEDPELEDDDLEVEEPDIGSRDLDKEKLNSELDDALGEEIDKQKSDLGLGDMGEDEEDDMDSLDEDYEDGVVDDDEDYDEDDEDLEDEDSDSEDGDDEEDDGLGSDDFGMDDEDFGDEDEDVNIADEELGSLDNEDDEDEGEETDDELDEDPESDETDDDETGDEDPDSEEEDSDPEDEDGDADTEDSDKGDDEDSDKDEDGESKEKSDKSKNKDGEKDKDKKQDEGKDYEPKLADVVHFRKDKTDKREFMLIDKYDLKNNSNVTAYKFYDITNQPDTYQLVLISKDKKMNIGSQVKKVRRGDMEEYRDYYKILPDLKESRVAITS